MLPGPHISEAVIDPGQEAGSISGHATDQMDLRRHLFAFAIKCTELSSRM
jgi:hypothetical protein